MLGLMSGKHPCVDKKTKTKQSIKILITILHQLVADTGAR